MLYSFVGWPYGSHVWLYYAHMKDTGLDTHHPYLSVDFVCEVLDMSQERAQAVLDPGLR